jgi:Protein of unknown function (DUF3300)
VDAEDGYMSGWAILDQFPDEPIRSRATRTTCNRRPLCALLIPVSQADLLAQQSAPPPPSQDVSAAAPAQPLSPDQLDQLIAPIALYPDALIAQTLAASTYPTEIVDADRWLQTQTGASPQQIASKVNGQSWDPSVKALTAVPDSPHADGQES